MKQKGFVSVDARWENVKECIFIGVLDQEKNQEYFEREQIPHYDWEGLSFFCMLRQEREDRIRLIHVNEFMTKAWGHCFQNVFVQGINNTEKDSVLIKTEREYIFTNRMRAHGTAGVFSAERCRNCRKRWRRISLYFRLRRMKPFYFRIQERRTVGWKRRKTVEFQRKSH